MEKHLRVVYSIPQHREYMRSGYSSEPLLAEAAAQILYEAKVDIPAAVAGFVTNGLVSKGESGELAMRTLLQSAYDRAIRKEYPPNDQAGAWNAPIGEYSRGVKLTTFLLELFAVDVLGVKGDSTNVSLDAAFHNSYVRFTHFGVFDIGAIKSGTACAAFARGMAMQVSHNQPMIDCVIPVLMQDTQLHENNISAILIQCKNRVDKPTVSIRVAGAPAGIKSPKTDDRLFDFFRRENDFKSYIVVVMHLGVSGNLDTGVDKGGVGSRQAGPAETRYLIVASGMTSFKEVSARPEDRAVWDAILTIGSLESEHPRQNTDAMQVLYSYKMPWSSMNDEKKGRINYGWLGGA